MILLELRMIIIDQMKPKAIIVSGYFHPSQGAFRTFDNAKAMGDKLFVIVNNDFQRHLRDLKSLC